MRAEDVPRPPVRVWLDDDPRLDAEPLPCRVCGTPTRMRDRDGKPCHISCAKREEEQRQLYARLVDERFPSAKDVAGEVRG